VVAAIIRAKALASWLGPQGTGVMAQLASLTAVLVPLATLGAGNGVVALIAEARGRGDLTRVARIERTTITLSWVLAGALALVTMLGSPWIARGMYQGPEYFWVVILGAASVPFLAVASLRISMLQGHEAIRQMAVLNALIAGVGIVTILPLAWFFRLPGAVFQLLIVALAYAWISHRMMRPYAAKVRAAEALAEEPRKLVDRALLPAILRYGVSALLVGLSSTLTLLILRSVLVQRLGLASNGIYQVCVGISGLYMPMILSSITATLWPQIAAQPERADTVESMRQGVRLSYLLMTTVAAAVLIAAPVGVPLLYSDRFLPALALLPLQFLGDYFRAGAWMFGVWLVPKNRLRPWVLFDVIYGLVLLGAFLLLSSRFGIKSVVIAYVAAHVTHAVLHYQLARRTLGFSLGADNRRLLLASFVLLVGFALWTPHDIPGALLAAAAAVAWALVVVRRQEWTAVWTRARATLQGWATK
jgi:O-antigen/teichoic acid export membrane protein